VGLGQAGIEAHGLAILPLRAREIAERSERYREAVVRIRPLRPAGPAGRRSTFVM
jgi:hypothetical protein